MRTIGIDLSSQPEDTAVCEIHWGRGRARIVKLSNNWPDGELVRLLRRQAPIAVDVPLGWPTAFVDNVKRWGEFRIWNVVGDREHRLRATDRWLADPSSQRQNGHSGEDSDVRPTISICPLSVSSDRIAVPAMRAALLLSRAGLHRAPRDGSARLVEVYPAAALKVWNLPSRKYKGPDGRDRREEIVNTLRLRLGRSLRIAADEKRQLIESDHCLDAWLAALVARAHSLRLTFPIPNGQKRLARREGWIRLPVAEALERLVLGNSH